MSKVLIFVAALALFVTAGCGNSDRAGGNRPTSFKRGNPDMMIREAVQSRTALASIAGKGVMRIVDQPTKFGLTVNANVVADQNDRLRIRADKLAGAIQAFDVVMLGDDIGFYIPTQKTLYHGKVDDLRGFAFRFDPNEVLNQMLRPSTNLLRRKWRYADVPAKAGTIVLEENAPPGRPRLSVVINERNGTIMSITTLDPKGQPVLVKRYDDYRSLARASRGGNVSDQNAVFPYTISFVWPRDKRSMEMQFKQVTPNAPVTEDDFEMATSSDTRSRPLREARMESDTEPSMAQRPRPRGAPVPR